MTVLTKIMADHDQLPYEVYTLLNIDSIDSVLDEFGGASAYYVSEDLNSFNNCLSEASKISGDEGKRRSIFSEVYYVQMSFWSLIFFFLYTYAWTQHRKKFVMTCFVIVPLVLTVCLTIASLLNCIIFLSKIFATNINLNGMFNQEIEEPQPNSIRQRLGSTSSTTSQYKRSLPCNELPRPLCRKHSTSNASLSNVSANATSSSDHRSPFMNSRKFSRLTNLQKTDI